MISRELSVSRGAVSYWGNDAPAPNPNYRVGWSFDVPAGDYGLPLWNPEWNNAPPLRARTPLEKKRFGGGPTRYWGGHLPLWIPFVFVAFPSGLLWLLHRIVMKRPGAGQCPKCGYDRRGLAVDAGCPECGTISTTPRSPP
jgi:hypothetical protein